MAPDPARFAALLCDYCLEIQPGQQVVVRSSTLAAPLLLALQEEILVRDAWPLIRTELPGADEAFWQHARDAHLDGFPAAELAEAQATDASIGIQAPANTRALAHVDAQRMARAARARAPVREAALARRWCLTLWPTAAGAKPSRWTSRAARQNTSSAPGSAARTSGHASRASSSSCSASSSGAASVVERTTTCWPGCTSRQ